MANQTNRLARLIRDADKCAGGATAAVQSAIKDIKGRIALATQELNLAGKAADRDKLFAEIHDRISRLEGELTRYLNAAAEMGSTAGFQAGKDETGLQVKYSAERANAILETVTERNGGELAATFTQNMENEIVGALRTATVEAIRAQAITGGTLKGMSKDLAQRMKDAARDFTFTDSRGRKWDSAAYFQMNTRTNAMRIYNDTLADTIARATGSDLARISVGGDPNCKHCFPWEGRVISLTGKTPGFPTYEDARAAGCFHPNCVHTLEYLDETADADEIALQKQFPPERDEEGEITADAADKNRYEIDIARKMADNPELDATAAKVLVDRDNLAASIRNGAIRADAEKIVAGLTDAQVAALCPDGNPPAFMAAKDNPDKGAEGWNKGSFGGKVYVKGDLTADKLLSVTNTAEAKTVKPIDAATAGAVAKGLKKVDAEAAAQAKAEADAAKQAEAERKAAEDEKKRQQEEERETTVKSFVNRLSAVNETIIPESTFADAPTWLTNAISQSVLSCRYAKERLSESNYGASGGIIFVSTGDSTKENKGVNFKNDTPKKVATFIHESGHCIHDKINGYERELKDSIFGEIRKTARKEVVELIEKWTGVKKGIEFEDGASRQNVVQKLFGVEHEKDLTPKQVAALDGVIDTMNAAFGRGFGFSGTHDKSYYDSWKSGRTAEIFAEVVASIGTGDNVMQKALPKTVALVEGIIRRYVK